MLPLLLAVALVASDSLAGRLERDLTPWLAQQASAGRFSGVVLVARHGVPIYSAAYGMADRERGVKNTIDTRFNLGSANKMWTAIAIAQLVEQGKVDLDAPVGRYVPELTNAALRDKVKIRHLLSHTSGLDTYFQKGFLRNKTYVNTMADYLPFYENDELKFEPGARMLYSNAGMALLGLVIEKVSGQSFYDYMASHVLSRAGMKRAAYLDVRGHPRDVAVGYGRPEESGPETPNWDFIEQRSGPAGGAYASAPDLVAFSQALWSGRLLKPELVREFTTGKVAMGPLMKYAFGFGTGDVAGWRMVGHNGGIAGANAEFMAFPDQGIDVVVLANMEPPVATTAAFKVMEILTGKQMRFEVR